MNASISLPPLPALLAFPPVGLSFLSFDTTSPSNILSISPPVELKILP